MNTTDWTYRVRYHLDDGITSTYYAPSFEDAVQFCNTCPLWQHARIVGHTRHQAPRTWTPVQPELPSFV